VAACFFRLGAPNDTLVQGSDPHSVILRVELEHQLIHGLRHVIDAARVCWIQDVALEDGFVIARHVDAQVTLRDFQTVAIVTVNAHRAEVNDVNVFAQLGDGGQHVVRAWSREQRAVQRTE